MTWVAIITNITPSNTNSHTSLWKDQDDMPNIITMTSLWARWRLKSPASRLFTQPFIQKQIKENIKAPRHWPFGGEFTDDRWIPRTNGHLNAENVSISWRHHIKMFKCFNRLISAGLDTAWRPSASQNFHRGKWIWAKFSSKSYIDGLVQDCSISLHEQWRCCNLSLRHWYNLYWKLRNFGSRTSKNLLISRALSCIIHVHEIIEME